MIDERDQIIKDNIGLIKSCVFVYSDGSDPDDWDDLFGAAMLGAAKALDTWDKDRGAKFSTFLRRCCRNAIIDELRKKYRWNNDISASSMGELTKNSKNTGEGGETSDWMEFIDTIVDGTSAPAAAISSIWTEERLNPEEELIHKQDVEYAKGVVAKLQSKLNERELFVLWHTILTDDPMTYRDMGKQFGCSKDAILRDYKRICKMLKED